MGRIVVTEYVSVDRVVEAPSGTEDFARVGWTDPSRGPEGDAFKWDETMASAALLLARVTDDAFAEVWPNVEGEFAEKLNAMPKYVGSSTLESPSWNNTGRARRSASGSSTRSGRRGVHILAASGTPDRERFATDERRSLVRSW